MRSVYRLFLVALVLGIAAPLIAQDASRPAALGSPAPRATHGRQPNTYGGSVESKFLVPANAFFPLDSSQTYSTDLFGGGPRWITGGLATALVAPLHLPSGAKVVSLELGYSDSNGSNAVYASLFDCDFLGTGCFLHPTAGDGPGDCNTGGFICSGTANAPGPGYFFDTLIANDNITIDNYNNHYMLYVDTKVLDGSLKLASMIVGYVLQVSPAPATATFSDVPTSDFAFQFIEAFNAAGITVGCNASPPMFCPDRNVTRREMAVFFAKALGLQFP